MKLLVIGADGLIGASLCRAARARSWTVRGTSRRPVAPGFERLDLADDTVAPVLQDAHDVVILCAALSRHDQCAAAPQTGRLVNVESPVRIAQQVQGRGAHVIFLSTDSVFGERNAHRGESDPVSPEGRVYPMLKAQAEARLQAVVPAERLTIVRLTKVVSVGRDPFATWCQRLATGRPLEALTDLTFAPVSLRQVTQSLLELCSARHPGILHLSGEHDLNYADFAALVCRQAGADVPVHGLSAQEAGIRLDYRPTFSRLDMTVTGAIAGWRPQPAEAVVADLLAESAGLSVEQEARPCDIAA